MFGREFFLFSTQHKNKNKNREGNEKKKEKKKNSNSRVIKPPQRVVVGGFRTVLFIIIIIISGFSFTVSKYIQFSSQWVAQSAEDIKWRYIFNLIHIFKHIFLVLFSIF
jgi:hypothetical protein